MKSERPPELAREPDGTPLRCPGCSTWLYERSLSGPRPYVFCKRCSWRGVLVPERKEAHA